MKLVSLIVFSSFYLLINAKRGATCITPNGETGRCITLCSCRLLRRAYDSGVPHLQKFVEDSACGNKKFTVCCGTSLNLTKTSTAQKTSTTVDEKTQKELKRKYALEKLLPTRTYCGMQHYDDYFHDDETIVSVDEFPWLLDLESQSFSKMGGSITVCSAILISKRYALTIRSCIVPKTDERYIYSTRLKFGSYNWRQNVSCIETKYGDDCTEPLTQVYVEETTYIKNSDIVLLRLEQKITYNDFVRPLCLPLKDTFRPKLNDTVLSSGWGSSESGDDWIKKRILNRIASEEECKKLYTPEEDENKLKNFECVRAIDNLPKSCAITLGGSTVYKYGNNWIANGILKSANCSIGVHYVERITPETVNYILENMKD